VRSETSDERKNGLTDISQRKPNPSTTNITDIDESPIVNHPTAFSFPTLSPDGSVEDLRETVTHRSYPTPPAALSSLGAKLNMADTMTDSTSSLDDAYDMLDDASDISSDHDTASLLSADKIAEEDDLLTPSEEKHNESHKLTSKSVHQTRSTEQGDSLLSEDLETIRQSTMTQVSPIPPPSPDRVSHHAAVKKSKGLSPSEDVKFWDRVVFRTIVMSLIMTSILFFTGGMFGSPVVETSLRKEVLTLALGNALNCTDVSKAINLDHLLPTPSATSTGIFGQALYSTPTAVTFDTALPNHVVFSLPKKHLHYPTPRSVRVHRGGRELAHNCTKLIDGVYDVTIDPTQAYGSITVEMETKNPVHNVTAEHNFGNKMLQRKTYEHAGTELSKSVNKELTVLTKAARSLREAVGSELSAGAAATKNVTAQIVHHVATDLIALANSATSMVGKVGQGCNQTAVAIRKDLMTVQKDVVKFTKQTLHTPLKMSMDHARGFRDKVVGRSKSAANSTTAVSTTSFTKELSTYFHSLVKPLKPMKKPRKLTDVARCLPAKDFAACRKAQKAKSLSVYSTSTSLSTVPGQGVTAAQSSRDKKLATRQAQLASIKRKEGASEQAVQQLNNFVDRIATAMQEAVIAKETPGTKLKAKKERGAKVSVG